MPITQQELARRLRAAREACHLKQDDVARHLGVSRPTIAQIELGNRAVSTRDAEMQFVFPILREALETLRRSPAEVVVLDVRMPEMSGLQVWEAVRGMDAAQARRTVFCTGDVVSDEVKAFLASTGWVVVNKPFAPARLLDAVAQASAR